MPQLECTPQNWGRSAQKASKTCKVLLEAGGAGETARFSFEAIHAGIFRTRFWSDSHVLPPYKNIEDPPIDVSASCAEDENSSTIESQDIEAHVIFQGPPLVSIRWKDSTTVLHSDLPDRSYVQDGAGTAHYMRHDRNALHVGLGEKAAPMDLTARHFINSATDCFGYEVYKTDPMYKHIPLLIKATPEGCVGIFSTSHSRGTWSVGSEIDGLWGHFKVYRQDYGGLEEYILVGRTLKDVVRLYAELAGFPLLVPRWAYGYLSGGYKYTMGDDPPAHEQLMEFADKLREHDIPCSAHQMSSGYSIAETEPKVRNVFTWNRHRFPDPEKWLSKYHARGIRLLSNIKPFILSSHPDYKYLVDSNALFTNPRTGNEGVMKLWSAGGGESGNGGHLDFTSDAAFDWWARGVQKLKDQGVDAMWNDNNEYTLPDDRWQMALDRYPAERQSQHNNSIGLWGRALHCELMAKASHDGLLRAAPDERPFVLTRSGTPGTFRYAASSWSGDNMTSWEGMKGANAVSLTAGMCLMQCYGHDIGGFEGPQPSPELLLRWVQLGIYSPRFAINCFKTSKKDNSVGETIEPWMYPEITPQIRDTIKRRYEILPYIYSLGLESHLYATPPQRWVGWGYEEDPMVWSKPLKNGEEQFWFGDTLLIGGVYEPAMSTASMYLPRKKGFFDYGYLNTNAPFEYFASGQWVEITSNWRESIPVLAKVGGAVPIGKNMQTRMPGEERAKCQSLEDDDYRGVEIFPPRGSSHGQTFESTWYDDDGISRKPDISSFTVRYESTEDRIIVGFETGKNNVFIAPWQECLTFILLPGDERFLVSEDGVPLERLINDLNGRPRHRMALPVANRRVREVMVNGHA